MFIGGKLVDKYFLCVYTSNNIVSPAYEYIFSMPIKSCDRERVGAACSERPGGWWKPGEVVDFVAQELPW